MVKLSPTYYRIDCDICKWTSNIHDRLTAQNIMLWHLQRNHDINRGGLDWMKMIANEYLKMGFVYELPDSAPVKTTYNKIESSDIIKFFAIMVQDGDLPKQDWIMT